MPDLLDSFRAIVHRLTEVNIPFAVCGGLAVSIHTLPRATVDIDLLAPADALTRLGDVLEPLGFVRRHRAPLHLAQGQVIMHRFTKIVPGDPDVLGLDVIEARAGVTADAWATRVSAEWEGRSITVVSREGLIALKRLRGSPRDVIDIATLERGG